MTPEVRRTALRAAAKAALVVSIGCGGGSKTAPPSNIGGTGPTPPAPVAGSCDEHLASLARGKPAALAPDDPVKARPDLYGEVFTDRAAREDARTQSCCAESLGDGAAESKYRWECCSAIADSMDKHHLACTPWGPPCPPEMV